ncbi:erythromycin esterase family protein [Methanolobus chelungpuianus]|uniref:Erythromycin esterase n=1 Tax=Methanolobus chelungpuianus TaxID=502115 RepID=A0AAE3H9X1_9EURY|nr:erythromycin esterase family protein [Methanolobus chelungpuianus]MCQ6961903.1 erythromycin esterase [Methanolobus chelungpuianus]
MSDPSYIRTTLDEWVAKEAIPFSVDLPGSFSTAVDKMIASLGERMELLGLGEALHGGEDILELRNRLFQYLAEAHGYSAIAMESSFPRGFIVNEYIAGRGPACYDEVQEAGFSHGFGRLEANRELVEWMRGYNADPSHAVKLRFYGFDSPTEMMYADSPGHLLRFVLDYLASVDVAGANESRERIGQLLGPDARWENTAAAMDPTQSVGLSPAATALRIETEDLISELSERRPELISKSGESRYTEVVQYATMARKLLNYHAVMARESPDRLLRLLGIRDAMMADTLEYIVSREHGRGKVLAFAHNSHLQRGKAHMQLGPYSLAWWPAGSHLDVMFGPRYAVIGSGVGISAANGIGRPEAGTLEARLTAAPGPVRFIPTRRGQGLADRETESLPIRTGSMKNPTYFALTPGTIKDFDWLAVLDSTAYSRGGPPLQY